MQTIRLQKYLAECGIASRRESETLITAGRVAVNGAPAELGQRIDPKSDHVSLDGEPVARDDKVYVLLHKPRGVITSAKDTHARKTVLDCVEGAPGRLFPVGRLDRDVSGALLLTNDGELAYRVTHPSFGVEKMYIAWVEGRMNEKTAQRLERGVDLEDGRTAPATVAILKHGTHSTQIRLVVHEGRKRLVKRMCAAVGHPVKDLRRLAIGDVHVTGLAPGEWRYLTKAEVQGLCKCAGLQRN